MLEIAIIICLAVSFFLVLRHFPRNAEESITKAIVSEKKESPLSNLLGKIFEKKERKNVSEIANAIDQGKEDIINPGQINEARKEYRETDPEIARLLFEADNAFLKEDLREAENLALEAIGKDKKCGQAYVIMGQVSFLRGSYSDARDAYNTALKCDKENAEAYYGIGMIKLREENLSDGVEYLQKAVVLERGNPEWYFELGRAYMQIRQFAKAAKAFKRASALDMDNKEYKKLASEAEDKQRSHADIYRKAR